MGLRDATLRLKSGSEIILDGSSGVLIVDPTQSQIAAYAARAAREAADTAELEGLSQAEPVTIDGVRVTLRANVDLPEEAEAAAHSGAEGVGLMRTEFLVVGRAAMPDEEEQYKSYKKVV